MLILADKQGIIDMTPQSMARRTNLPLEMILEAIPKLESPDPLSRTPTKDGKRIERLDNTRSWGWRIVNYEKYRESATAEMLRLAEAERKKAYRAKFGRRGPPRPPVDTDTEAEAEAEQSRTKAGLSRTCPGQISEHPSLEEVKSYSEIIGLAAWKAEDFFHEMEACGWKDYNHRAVAKWQPMLIRIRTKWEADGRPTQPPTNNGNNRPSGKSSGVRNHGTYNDRPEIHKQYDAKVVRGAKPVPDQKRPDAGTNVGGNG